MAKRKVRAYIRKNPIDGIYQSTVGEGDNKKTIIIKNRNCFSTDNFVIQKFLDNDSEIVLADFEPPKPAEDNRDDDNSVGSDDTNIGEFDPGENDPEGD